MHFRLLNFFPLYLRALLSVRKATALSSAGRMFNHYGRQLGWRLIWRLSREGFSYVINPVSSFRYFEFPFALSSLGLNLGRCLDASSPRLFSFYVSDKRRPQSIWMINPDRGDIQHSSKIVEKLKIANIQTDCYGVEVLENIKEKFNTIWSISVIEHISGKYDDRVAIMLMYSALAYGGRLILTIPVDRQYWEEYRDRSYYGVQEEKSESGSYFFQRYYDKTAIWKRLVDSIGVEPSSVRWYGEKNAGHFVEYEKRWLREGLNCTYDDPKEMSENYQEYPSWDMMPGKGVCGLVFMAPKNTERR